MTQLSHVVRWLSISCLVALEGWRRASVWRSASLSERGASLQQTGCVVPFSLPLFPMPPFPSASHHWYLWLACLFIFSDFNKTVADIPPCLFLSYIINKTKTLKRRLCTSQRLSLWAQPKHQWGLFLYKLMCSPQPILLMSMYRLSSDGCPAGLCLT